jgi:phosphatidylserine/phosphatidylglycerophosphate/cardiolipin synthase-like enzyme
MAQLLDADSWLAVPDTGVAVARWHDGNLVQPIQEGTPYFTQLVTGLRNAKPGGAVEFAGWAFVKGSETDDDVDWSLIPFDNSTVFLSLIKELRSANVTVGMLVNRFLQFDSPTLDDFQYLAAILFTVYLAALPLSTLLKAQTDPAAYMLTLIAVAAVETVLTSPLTETIIKDELEYSQDFMTALAAFDATIATWTPYPAAFLDNPLIAPGPVKILGSTIDDISHIGVYHQKYVNIQFPGTAMPPYTAYLGGIDINSDRPDTTIHRALHPFHDVQIQLNGPAVAETIRSYAERASAHGANAPIAQPSDGQIPDAGSHIVQIARTYFKPGPGSGTPAYDFAPNGETTPVRTIKNAIAQARDFIYIEDQYFTPPEDYVQALIEAGTRVDDSGQQVQALFITVPYQTDQPYGGQRRTPVLDALQSAWGSRLYVGTPFRRFLHEVPVLTTNLGRMRLAADMTEGAVTCSLSPAAHVPAAPFWAFISGELMLITNLGAVTGTGATSAQAVSVVRAAGNPQAPDWGAKPVPHAQGSPVLAVQVPGIYVHAKVMVVDDVFLFVGSSNINRRGLYHDGEMNSFTIPKHLRGDPANPARILRSRLMAEHAGLSPEMGQGLFADPLSAIPYFTNRPWYAGVPRQPLTFLGDEPQALLGGGASVGTWLLNLLAGPIAIAATSQVWPLLVDPTTTLDPNPGLTGPAYP